MKRFLQNIDFAGDMANKTQESYRRFIYGVLSRYQSQVPKTEIAETDRVDERKDASLKRAVGNKNGHPNSEISRPSSSDDEELSDRNWRLEHLEWLSKALEPALQLCRWALPSAGNGVQAKSPPSTRSVSEIITSIQRSKIGIQDWSLSDLTLGLYLIYLRQASANPLENISGVQVSSDAIVQDLIYHTELAKGAYKDSAASLARHSMLRESNVLKFVKNSSVLRPGYYVGIDHRKKLVIFGIRGTHTVYDLITDIVSSSDEGVTFEGYSTHFGTAEAARWFLTHEVGTLKKCLDEHKGYKLRLVGHSLGGATAALLAKMLRKKSMKQLGFSPEIVSAVGYATPPCVSRELAESCSDYVTTVVMQDDIIPRLSVASLTRLRNEILQTDWMSVIEKEDWKSFIDLVSNAKQVVSSVQDVARKLADYAKFRNSKESIDVLNRKDLAQPKTKDGAIAKREVKVHEELFVPGTVYYLNAYLGGISIGMCFFATLVALLVSLAIVPRQVMPWTGLLLMYEWMLATFFVLFGGYLHLVYKWGNASAVQMGAFTSGPDSIDYDSGKGHQRQASHCDAATWFYGLGMAFLSIAAPALPCLFGITALFLRLGLMVAGAIVLASFMTYASEHLAIRYFIRGFEDRDTTRGRSNCFLC